MDANEVLETLRKKTSAHQLAVGDVVGVVRLDEDGNAMMSDGRVHLARCLVVHINDGKGRFTLCPAIPVEAPG